MERPVVLSNAIFIVIVIVFVIVIVIVICTVSENEITMWPL